MNKFFMLPVLTIAIAGLTSGCAAVLATGAATGVAVVHDQRSTGAIIDDQSIEIKATGSLTSDRQIFKETHINVTSYNGMVLVTGEAPTEELRNRVIDIVRKIDRVKRVYNEVKIAAPSSLVARSSDSLITGKVKGRLLGTKGFDSTRVKVVTEAGVVYLLGLVTRAEADIATEAARQTDGVQRVVKIFEYVD
ncbi:MAG TPA: BON domain-containing protein [Gammaproteobacteria bacterium]|nr:BON domain-containing protein [Gammaproteobacteria bacterium]